MTHKLQAELVELFNQVKPEERPAVVGSSRIKLVETYIANEFDLAKTARASRCTYTTLWTALYGDPQTGSTGILGKLRNHFNQHA